VKKWIAILIACMIVMTMIGARVERVAALEPPACAVEHRTAAAIVESAGSGDESIPIPEAIPYSAPEGIPADPATIERVTVLAESLVGCVNGGDIVGFMSLLSNDFLRRHFSDFDLSLEEMTQLAATPTPLDEQLVLVAISDVTELPDGRIGVLVLLDQGEIESPELSSRLTLVEIDGHLLIDEWQPVLIERGGDGDGLQVVCGEGDGWQMVWRGRLRGRNCARGPGGRLHAGSNGHARAGQLDADSRTDRNARIDASDLPEERTQRRRRPPRARRRLSTPVRRVCYRGARADPGQRVLQQSRRRLDFAAGVRRRRR
jgi:hypothetical protein